MDGMLHLLAISGLAGFIPNLSILVANDHKACWPHFENNVLGNR